MTIRSCVRNGISLFVILMLTAITTTASALTPTLVWQKAGASRHAFSTDGSALLLATASGFELRKSSDGALLNAITLPTASLSYKDVALSPDKQHLALVLDNRSIEIWRVSNSSLARTITTDAVRDIKTVALSNAFVASMERFAYGGGGMLRVHDIATGALVKTVLAVRNSSPQTLQFSPDGQYLGHQDHYAIGGIVVLRTSDWGTALTVPGTMLFGWSRDSSALWTYDYRRIRVPDGAVLQTVPPPPDTVGATSFTPDNRFFLASVFADFQYTNAMEFLRTSDVSVRTTYTFPSASAVYAGQIDATGSLFTYSICSSQCTVYVARVPAL